MSVSRIVMGCIISAIAVALGIYTFFAAQCKGPILSNSYLLLSKEERMRADKKAEYKLVTVVFGCLAAAFALLALWILQGGIFYPFLSVSLLLLRSFTQSWMP